MGLDVGAGVRAVPAGPARGRGLALALLFLISLASIWALSCAALGWLCLGLSPLRGGVCGCLGLALQLLSGRATLRWLLPLRPGPWRGEVEGRSWEGPWMDEPCPYLLYLGPGLGGRGGLVPTRGLLEDPGLRRVDLEADLLDSVPPPLGDLLVVSLGLPALLRAFHAATERYARLRGGGGALSLPGRLALLWARVLESACWPLRARFLRRWGGAGRSEALQALARGMVRVGRCPVWVEALSPVGPLSCQEIRELSARSCAFGAPEGTLEEFTRALGDRGHGAHPALRRRLAALERRREALAGAALWIDPGAWPVLGAGLGLATWTLPVAILAAPLLLTAAGIGARLLWEHPRSSPRGGTVGSLWALAARRRRGLRVRLAGRLVRIGPDRSLAPGLYLDDGTGLLRLEGEIEGLGGEGVAEGWLVGGEPALKLEEVRSGELARRTRRYARGLGWGLAAGLPGGLWWALQALGR